MPYGELTLHIPEAGCLVWVVDGQADSSNVLQSLWRQKAIAGVKTHSSAQVSKCWLDKTLSQALDRDGERKT